MESYTTGDMQRIGKATLKALHEPEGSREQDKDEEDKELPTPTTLGWGGVQLSG